MSDKIYDVPAAWATRAYVDDAKYSDMYARSVGDSDAFWSDQAKRLDWIDAPTKIENVSYAPGNISIKWFEDGVLNAAYNCIDRHLPARANQTAIIWEGDDPSQSKHISYQELHDEVARMANVLRNRNVGKGDRVTIYLPMIPETRWRSGSPIASRRSSSRLTKASAAARRCRSRRMSMRQWPRRQASTGSWWSSIPARRSTWIRSATSGIATPPKWSRRNARANR
jgi:hypothetical protein